MKLLYIFLLLTTTASFSQSLTGTVTDIENIPLERANVIARPLQAEGQMQFSITDKEGKYNLTLDLAISYEITVSYIGYFKETIYSNPDSPVTEHHFVMKPNPEGLETVTINYKYQPISVKKDTIVYNVDAFNIGTERKLRDVLKNLPGVEVDREGNVQVNGKRVNRVLVEGKVFFTGNSKLAVNNIPADAVNQVEVLDNYSDVAMLKGLEDSEEMVLNIKLKEDKKQFVFGDIEAGGGIKERYVFHPKLFYYSPKTSVNLIGDMNNIAEKSFTVQDYMEFEGGISKLISNMSAYVNLFNSDIARFLANQDYTSNVSQFGGLNIRQAVSSSTDISGYIISSNNKTKTKTNTFNQYTSQVPFSEERTNSNNSGYFFTLAKISLQHKPHFEKDFSWDSFMKFTALENTGFITSDSPMSNYLINTDDTSEGVQVKQDIKYTERLSKAHTITIEAAYDYIKDNPFTHWQTNQPILQSLIPLQEEEVYNILQDKKNESHNADIVFKDYWILHRFHHLYSSVGFQLSFADFYSEDYQLLSNGEHNNFSEAGFGNDFRYRRINTFVGLEYKFQQGIVSFKPALFSHFYQWQTRQINEKNNHYKTVLIPKLDIDFLFSNAERLSFKYSYENRFPTVPQLAGRYILYHFNSVFKGNSTLENQQYHSASLRYFKHKMFQGYRLNLMTSVQKRESQFKNVTQLSGIEQYNTVMLFENPEHFWTISGGVSKDLWQLRPGGNLSYNYTDFYQLVNQTEHLNISKSVTGSASVKTLFKKVPSLEIGYSHNYNNYRTSGGASNFENNRFYANLDYTFLKDFILKTDYSYNEYKNVSSGAANDFDNLNVSLFYQKENSPWGFEIQANNLLNTASKQQNFFSDFLISDTKTFIFPRVILLKAAYKL